MKLLAIDTSTEACSTALHIEGDSRVRYQVAPRMHAELILPMVDELLNEANIKLNQLDALAFGRGPGAFTGVRVATGVIQGLAYSVDLPVIPVSSLAALAQSLINEQANIITAFDARMGEIYYGAYQRNEAGLAELINEEAVEKPDEVIFPDTENWYGLGTGWQTYSDILNRKLDERSLGFKGEAYPSAEHIIPLAINAYEKGQTVSAEQAVPVYLRNKVTG